jgi:Golgi apyrase
MYVDSSPSPLSCAPTGADLFSLGRWGVILDAGSSGTRVHVYRWLNNARAVKDADAVEMHNLPKLKTKKDWTMKIKPGVSTFADHPADLGRDHLQKLLDHALSIVPEDQVEDTPIFLMATAGVRLLEPMQQRALLAEVCSYAQQHTKFSLPECDLHIQVIPGETEGLYGWIAANYLLGGFDSPQQHAHGDGHHTYGFLDMGGASAQIAFAPNSTEAEKHANDLKLLRMRTLDGQQSEYKVFTTTWLGFGVNRARERYVKSLVDETFTPDATELLDPCLPVGLKTTLNGDPIISGAAGSESVLMGTGQFDECLAKTYPLLDKDAPCADQPCLLHGQHVPAIDFHVNHFVGVSEYWHTTHEVFEMSHNDKAYDFTKYQKLVKDFCSNEWDDIQNGVAAGTWGKKVTARTAQEVCFKASWLINILHDGIGIPREGIEKDANVPGYNVTKEVVAHASDRGFLDPFQAVDKIDGVEVSWTLGKMILYAAGQIPPATTNAPAVGFGSNVAGSDLPSDFQYAGSNSSAVWSGDDDSLTEAAEDLAETAQKHSRSTGFALFVVVLIVIGYLFRKRERRLKLVRGVNATLRRGRKPGSPRRGVRGLFRTSKMIFNRGSGHYDRTMEDGEAAHYYELSEGDDDNEYSDGSEGSRAGPSFGLATPKVNVSGFEGSGYFGESPVHGPGVGLGLNSMPNAMDRSGLVVRTESRERLAPNLQMLGAGRRSRTGSPTRKSPLMTPLEEV